MDPRDIRATFQVLVINTTTDNKVKLTKKKKTVAQ